MKKRNEENGKINLYQENWFPKVSHIINRLNETEKRAIEVLVVKNPKDNWDKVAKQIGITRRQLFNIRQNSDVQDACYIISKELFTSDLPDVLKTLTNKAKSGEAWAVRIFLEIAGELGKENQTANINVFSPISNPRDEGKGFLDVREEIKNMSTEELQAKIISGLKLSNRGTKSV